MNRRPRIVVVGSLNLDLVVAAERFPRPGETVRGQDLRQVPGGKGANQAVAAARLGAEVALIGRVGDDGFGTFLRQSLVAAGVDDGAVAVTPGVVTGTAVIALDAAGRNAITVVAGANGRLTPADVRAAAGRIRSADVLLVQLEVPFETVAEALRIARDAGVATILDPAPAPTREDPLPDELFAVDVLTPNQTEAEALTGVPIPDADAGPAAALASARLLARGAGCVILKLGAAGARHQSTFSPGLTIPSPTVPVVDTTAAGDAFTAALGLAWARKAHPAAASRLATAVGALAVTKFGAQSSLPTRAEVLSLPPDALADGAAELLDFGPAGE